MQIAERRVPGPEVVDAEAHAGAAQLGEGRARGGPVSDQHALRQLQAQARRLDPAARQHLAQLPAELLLQQLAAGEVHREIDALRQGGERLTGLRRNKMIEQV